MGRVSERNLGLPSGHDGSVKYQVFHANFLMQYIGKLIYDGQCSTERAMNRDDLLLPHAAHWLDRGVGQGSQWQGQLVALKRIAGQSTYNSKTPVTSVHSSDGTLPVRALL